MLKKLYIFVHMKLIAEKLINRYSKTWLADKLGVTRVTLDNRLKKDNWKKSEIQMLLLLK